MSDRRKLFGKVIIAGEEFDFIKAANIKEVSLEYYKTRNLRNNKKYGIEIIKKEKNDEGIKREKSEEKAISNNELVDFVKIKRDLEHISMTVDSLKLWTDQMISSGNIDEVEYNRVKQEIEESEN